ncbi:MAG: polymer-forming cytoskeletal protein [Polyangiaceae bacterium]|nr:polymer-forming cytoskeletal protein [Polyangiaceae bacterium]
MSDTSIIGRATTIRGHVRGTGAIRVDGRVEGDVSTDGDVEVGPEAQIRGSVSGATLRVAGAVAGDLTGGVAVLLENGARVVGDLSAPRIGVTEGALVRGNVETGPSDGARPAFGSLSAVRREPEVARVETGRLDVGRTAGRSVAAGQDRRIPASLAGGKIPAPGAKTTPNNDAKTSSPTPSTSAKETAPATTAKTTPSGRGKATPPAPTRAQATRDAPRPGERQAAPVRSGSVAASTAGGRSFGVARGQPAAESASAREGTRSGRIAPPPVVPALSKGARVRKKKAGLR